MFYFEYQSGKFKLVWNDKIPKEVKFDCLKHMSPRGEFFLQQYSEEVCLYDRRMRLITKRSSPGGMLLLLPGGERAVVDNRCSPSTETEGIRLSVTSVAKPHDTHYQLDTPPDGPYTIEDRVRVCGLEDGRLAVVVRDKPFCDIYNNGGE